jgi:hypothetical protein
MCENGMMTSVEIVLRSGVEMIEEKDGGGESNYDILETLL